MAGDWIKMRGALLDHPKVIAVARALHAHRPFREWLSPGGGGDLNGQIVSDHALRCVTTALLMRVWSGSREHGKFVENDLVLEHSAIDDLDQMAGAPGVGLAMKSVGWAVEKHGVTLPNFKEFNVPMTSAEKQRSYRERQQRGNGGVTDALPQSGNKTVTREEKRRSKPPIYPPGFERLWSLWPAGDRKQAKGESCKEWLRGGCEPLVEVILAHVETMKQTESWRTGFVPAPKVYLHQRRWEGAELQAVERKVAIG